MRNSRVQLSSKLGVEHFRHCLGRLINYSLDLIHTIVTGNSDLFSLVIFYYLLISVIGLKFLCPYTSKCSFQGKKPSIGVICHHNMVVSGGLSTDKPLVPQTVSVVQGYCQDGYIAYGYFVRESAQRNEVAVWSTD